MTLITNSMLKGACHYQRKLFRKTFPDGAPITMVAARKAQKAGLNILWLLEILPNPMYDAYYAKRKQLNDEHWAKLKPLDDEYEAKHKPLDYEYEAKRKPLNDEYYAKCKPLDDEYYAKRVKILLAFLKRMKEA